MNRPLTLEELHQQEPYQLMWLECRGWGETRLAPIAYKCTHSGNTVTYSGAKLSNDYYGTKRMGGWRCWLEYPSIEERETAKWNER